MGVTDTPPRCSCPWGITATRASGRRDVASREVASEAGPPGSELFLGPCCLSLPIGGDSLPSSLGTPKPQLCANCEPVGPCPHLNVPTTDPRGAPSSPWA